MERIPVDSSNLRSVGYNPKEEKLEVEFNSGHVYQYSGVPNGVYDSLMAAESHGQFFAKNVRNNYSFIRLS